MIPDEAENRSIESESDAQALRKLTLILKTEQEKPDGARDEALIDDCIRQIAEIKGVRSSFSPEEVRERIADAQNTVRRKKTASARFLRWVIPAAVVVSLLTAVVSASISGLRMADLTERLFKSLTPGVVYHDGDVDLVIATETRTYSSLEELADATDHALLLPFGLEEELRDIEITVDVFDSSQTSRLKFTYRDSPCDLMIDYPGETNSIRTKAVVGGWEVALSEFNGMEQAEWVYQNDVYLVRANTVETLDAILSSLEQMSEDDS